MGTDPLMNLHTHTIWSDGSFLPEDLVRRAYSGGLKHIAITDHFETRKVENPLRADRFPRYLRNIHAVRMMYEGRINVLAGVEIDTNPTRCDLKHLPFDLLNQLDVILFEYVSDPVNGGIGLEEMGDVRAKIDVPCGLCHWDMDRIFGKADPNELADQLRDLDLFVEVSTSQYYSREGRQLYEHGERFYRAFDGKVKLSIGTDTHRRLDEVVNITRGQEFVKKLGMTDQMVL
ncbi:MAG: hypothetical protein A4E32_00593 [Methanomassiliicoccales archaeon PtaU1.Bin124]|nr:MAG: hypothetical protein A4E32_00593 [Methanomassiliicoccales archaeon PtaU1.Bin124]